MVEEHRAYSFTAEWSSGGGTRSRRVVRLTLSLLALGVVGGAATAVFYLLPSSRPAEITGQTEAGSGAEPARPFAETSGAELPAAPRRVHPLLGEADAAVLAEGIDEVHSTAGPKLAELIRAVVRSGEGEAELAPLTIDYPLDESIVPPEIVAPTFLWHDEVEGVDTWLFDVGFGNPSQHIYVLSPGDPPPAGKIDPEAIRESNEVYQPTPYQASAKAWTPSGEVWAAIKQRSVERAASVTILGLRGAAAKASSRGRITLTTSRDPVGAPIFYRDVPLAPSRTEEGVIKPLSDAVVPLIGWRLRDISKPQSRLVLTDMLNCTNCHSFSADGKTLGMDLDGPKGDKGAYVIAPVSKQMVIEQKHVISWNSFPDKPEGHKTIGFLSQISPDGQYAVTTLNEEVFVCNFWDYRFLQVFYPTRGILGYYSRSTGEIKALPGADDPRYVHCDPAWSPEGDYLVFARAEAKDAYREGGTLPARPNDPAETPIQYDLYRIPFDDGRGGKPEPIAGASRNGMSNTFPKVSPDGKWIVFVKCRNGQLLRPDSTLWIVPAGGGTARRMRCNTRRMNSWHSFSPNSRWMVFSSKANTPYTQMFLTHIDEDGNDSAAILIPNSTAANRAVNIPEFVKIPYEGLVNIAVPAVQHLRHALRGRELLKAGMLDEAMAEFDMAVRSQPDYVDGHVSAAVILTEKGMLDEAVAHLQKALELDRECWYAYANLGVILARQGRLEEAIAQFETSIELNPDHFEARANIGKALLDKGMLEQARSHFRAAVELSPEDPAGHFNLANFLFGRGVLEEAAAHLEQCVAVSPRFIDARLMLGRARVAQGEFESALAQLQNAWEIAPNDLRAINELAWLLATCPKAEVRDGARAVELAERACVDTARRDPISLTTLAAAYAEAGRWSEAVAVATTALDLVRPQNRLMAEEISQQLECYRQGKPLRVGGQLSGPNSGEPTR